MLKKHVLKHIILLHKNDRILNKTYYLCVIIINKQTIAAMTFSEYMTLSIKFRKDIFGYISKKEYQTPGTVIQGIKDALNSFDSMAESNSHFRCMASDYYENGKTTLLLEMLSCSNIGWSDIHDYNVMTEIDTFSASKKSML